MRSTPGTPSAFFLVPQNPAEHVPGWPRRRRLRRTRPRTRAASRAQKTRTVTGTAASSGTRALSAAPVAPATVPSGTRRLRRPSTTFPPRATRPLPAHFRVISTNSHSCGRARALSPPQQFYKAPATEGEETISFFRPHEVSPPTSASLEPASHSGTLEKLSLIHI